MAKKIITGQKAAFTSKINLLNILGFITVLLAYLGENSIIPATIAGFIVFVMNVILQKFFSTKTVVQTGVSIDWMMYLINFIGAALVVAEYLLDHQLFGIPPNILTMSIFILNLILRTFFTNQVKPLT